MSALEFNLNNEFRLNAVVGFLTANWRARLDDDKPLRVIVTSSEEKRHEQQNRYYWGIVIKTISEQAWVDGQQFGKDAWHEQMAQMFGIKEEIRLPNGTLTTRRKSTSDMKVREFSHYIEEVCAWAGAELGVRFPSPEYL
ncbi:MAG: recombination protein NinB [Burkholderiales bacterium]